MKQNKRKRASGIIFIFIILLLLFIYIFVKEYLYKEVMYPTRYKEYVERYSKENNLDPYLVYSIIKQESKFNPNAVSHKGAKGLMQVMESTAKDMNSLNDDIDLFEPESNIRIGCKYFRFLLDRYNENVDLALCAYNAGLGNVDKWKVTLVVDGKVDTPNIPFEQTKTYVINILSYYDKYARLYN